MSAELIIPDSAEAAAAAFGDGTDVTVIGGGTIVMQLVNYHRLNPERVLLLTQAGLSYVNDEDGTVTVGAATPLAQITEMAAPLGPCAANVADGEIRNAATIGGNLCSPTPPDHPSGDLQSALLALGATVRSVGPGGEKTEPVEEFLPNRSKRLVLDISFERPSAGAFAAFRRPHAHHFTPLAVSGTKSASGEIRLAATGAGPFAVRLPSAESAPSAAEAGQAALSDVEMQDDALLSAWYREQIFPGLVQQVVEQLESA